MATLTSGQIVPEFQNGDAGLGAGFALKNITAADVAPLAQWFSVVKWAVIGPVTGTASAATCTVAGTNVTIPTGFSADAAFLLAYGDAA